MLIYLLVKYAIFEPCNFLIGLPLVLLRFTVVLLPSHYILIMIYIIVCLLFLSHDASALQCNVPGECLGNLLGFTSQNNSQDCLATCKGNCY